MEDFRKDAVKDYPSSWFKERFYGFECGDGWLPIIKDLFDELIPLTKDMPDFRILQIKEKWGNLRIYVSGGGGAVLAAIDNATAKCDDTCDQCGDKGIVRDDGWVSVRCDLHARG